MAGFCLKYLNKLNGRKDPPGKYVISKGLEFCEGCGEWKRVVIRERRERLDEFGIIFFPFKITHAILLFLWKTLKMPYSIYKRKRNKSKD